MDLKISFDSVEDTCSDDEDGVDGPGGGGGVNSTTRYRTGEQLKEDEYDTVLISRRSRYRAGMDILINTLKLGPINYGLFNFGPTFPTKIHSGGKLSFITFCHFNSLWFVKSKKMLKSRKSNLIYFANS